MKSRKVSPIEFFCFIFIVIQFLILDISRAQSVTDLTQEEGNHTWAKSESWTWMGHLNEYTNNPKGSMELSDRGVALIHYYTRNETQFGNLNFKSSALTETQAGVGINYDSQTTYSDSANLFSKPQKTSSFNLKIQEDVLNIEFKNAIQRDQIKKVEMQNEDLKYLETQLLPLYPGLEITPQFKPVKYTFSANVGTQSELHLNMYQIWPSVAPNKAQIKFLGIEDSYTFSQPMLVAQGTFITKGISKKVVGLLFLDRQWCKDYFGKYIMGNPADMLRQNQALKFSHNWSAFHAKGEGSSNWYFVHLWKQFQRSAKNPDQTVDYTGIVWVKNGVLQDAIPREDFSWTGQNFIKNKSHVLLNYAVDREGYFPSEYQYSNQNNQDQLNIVASPRLQSLDQPIYLYEGYASGEGIWNGEKVSLKGRLESSRILFRAQDYQEIIKINSETQTNQKQTEHLQKIMDDEVRCEQNTFCFENKKSQKKAQLNFMKNDLKQKIAILKSHFKYKKPERDPLNPQVLIYH
jgi:hypothetical protein